jgi:hypothetical protein
LEVFPTRWPRPAGFLFVPNEWKNGESLISTNPAKVESKPQKPEKTLFRDCFAVQFYFKK